MKKCILPLALLLLLSGCMELPTENDCAAITKDNVIQQTSWGENLVNTDESVVKKANVTCWHNVALAYAAKMQPANATASCKQILLVSNDPIDTDSLEYEYILCIDSIAKRLRDPFICQNIDPTKHEFDNARCINNATPNDTVCVLSFALLALPLAVFLKRRKN